MIKKEGDKFVLYLKGKKIGSYTSRDKALARQVKMKDLKEDKADDSTPVSGPY
jgi:hypothetical protein